MRGKKGGGETTQKIFFYSVTDKKLFSSAGLSMAGNEASALTPVLGRFIENLAKFADR